ncbi:HECT domain-containing protein [Plasmodiophora brassicae]
MLGADRADRDQVADLVDRLIRRISANVDDIAAADRSRAALRARLLRRVADSIGQLHHRQPHRAAPSSSTSSKSSDPPVAVPSSSSSSSSLPFEAMIGVRLMCATMDVADPADPTVSSSILNVLLPLLSSMAPMTKTSSDDLGVLDAISRFLMSMLANADTVAVARDDRSQAISALLGLAIARASLADLLAVLQLILTTADQVQLQVVPFLQQLARTKGPLASTASPRSSSALIVASLGDASSASSAAAAERGIVRLPGGDLFAWGRGENGRLGIGSTVKKGAPVSVSAFSSTNLRQVATFANHALAVDMNDRALSWGKGDNGRLGHGSASHQSLPKEIEKVAGIPILSIACGLSHSLLLTYGGAVFSMGDGNNGRLGHRSSVSLSEPAPVAALEHVKVAFVVCGAYHSMAIDDDLVVYAWGKNESGQLGLGHRHDANVPTVVDALADRRVKMIACGWEHSLAATMNGEAYSWGSGYEASRPVLGHGTCQPESTPRRLEALAEHNVVVVSAGWDHALAVTSSGDLFSWGEGLSGKLGHGNSTSQEAPKRVAALHGHRVVWVDGGADHSVAITADGQAWAWGGASEFQLGNGQESYVHTPAPIAALTGTSLRTILAGDKYSLGVTGDPLDPAIVGTGGVPLPFTLQKVAPDANDALHASADQNADAGADHVDKHHEALLQLFGGELPDVSAAPDDKAFDPVHVAAILLMQLDRLSREQRYSATLLRQDEITSVPFCIDVRPVCFERLVALIRQASARLSAVLTDNDMQDEAQGQKTAVPVFIMRSSLRLLRCNVRRLVLAQQPVAALGFDLHTNSDTTSSCVDRPAARFALDTLNRLLLWLVDADQPGETRAPTAVWSGADAIRSEVVELLQVGLDLFYPSNDAKIDLLKTSICGTTSVAKLIGPAVLERMAHSSMTALLVPQQQSSSSSASARADTRQLLDLLLLLVNRVALLDSSCLPLLRFLSALQAHLIAWVAAEQTELSVGIVVDYAQVVLETALQLCRIARQSLTATISSTLCSSLVGAIVPVLVQSLSLLGLSDKLFPFLLRLVAELDNVAVVARCHATPGLDESARADQGIDALIHIVADALIDILCRQISAGDVPGDDACQAVEREGDDDLRPWLESPLFCMGESRRHGGGTDDAVDVGRCKKARSTPHALSSYVITPCDCSEFINDLLEERGPGGRFWVWLNGAMRAERVGAPQPWLDRACRAAFAAIVHHRRLVVEAVAYSRLIVSKNIDRGGPERRGGAYLRVPVELVEAWREAQGIRMQIMFRKTQAMADNDGDDHDHFTYESAVATVLAKASLLLSTAPAPADDLRHGLFVPDEEDDEEEDVDDLNAHHEAAFLHETAQGDDPDEMVVAGTPVAVLESWAKDDGRQGSDPTEIPINVIDVDNAEEDTDVDKRGARGPTSFPPAQAYDDEVFVGDVPKPCETGRQWRRLRGLVVSALRWRSLLRITLPTPMKQKLQRDSPFADLRRFFNDSTVVSVGAIRVALRRRQTRALQRCCGLRHLYGLLTTIQHSGIRAKLLVCLPRALQFGSPLQGVDGCGWRASVQVQRQALAIMNIAVETLSNAAAHPTGLDDQTCRAALLVLAQRLHRLDHGLMWQSSAFTVVQSLLTTPSPLRSLAWAVFRVLASQLARGPKRIGVVLDAIHNELQSCVQTRRAVDKSPKRARRQSASAHTGGGQGGALPRGSSLLLSTPVSVRSDQLGYRLPIATSSTHAVPSSDYSVMLWVMPVASPAAAPGPTADASSAVLQTVLVRFGSLQVFAPKLCLSRYDHKLQAVVTTSTGNEVVQSPASLPMHAWTHVVFSMEKRAATLTVTPEATGQPVVTRKTLQGSPRQPSSSSSSSPFFIGKALDSDVHGFEGRVAQVAFIRRAVSDSELGETFAGGRPSGDPADRASCQLLSLLWSIGPKSLSGSGRWVGSLLELLEHDGAALAVRIRVLRLLRRLLPLLPIERLQSPHGRGSDRIERGSMLTSAEFLVAFLMDAVASLVWTWEPAGSSSSSSSSSSPVRTEHHRMAVADEAIQLLRSLLDSADDAWAAVVSHAIRTALQGIAGLLREPIAVNSPAVAYAIGALAVIGGHCPMMRLGARVRLPDGVLGAVTWFRSRSLTMHVLVDGEDSSRIVNVRNVVLVDEMNAAGAAQRFSDVLLRLFTLALAERRTAPQGPASPPPPKSGPRLTVVTSTDGGDAETIVEAERAVIRSRLSSSLLKAVCLMIRQSSSSGSFAFDADLLGELVYVASLPTRLETRMDRMALEYKHQFAWARLRYGRAVHNNVGGVDVDPHEDHPPVVESPTAALPSPLASPTLTAEQRAQEVKVDHVAAMGFDREFCRLALSNSNWDENAAVEFLLVNLETLEAQKRAAEAVIAARPLASPRAGGNARRGRPSQSPKAPAVDIATCLDGLPPVDASLVEDHSTKETATDPFVERFFPEGSSSSLPITSFLNVPGQFVSPGKGGGAASSPGGSSSGPPAVGLDDDAPDLVYPDELRSVREMDDALGVIFARDAVVDALVHSDRASSQLAAVCRQDPHMTLRFIKLVAFRNLGALPVQERRLLRQLALLVQTQGPAAQGLVLEECLRHLEMAATPDWSGCVWGHRDLSLTDADALSKPRVELAMWMVRDLVDLPSDVAPVVRRLAHCLRSSNLPLRECIADLLTALAYRIGDDDRDTLQAFVAAVRASAVRRQTEQRMAGEEDRLIKSRYLAAMLALLGAVDDAERRLADPSSSSCGGGGGQPAPTPEEITTDAIELFWDGPASAEFALDMRPAATTTSDATDVPPAFHEVYRGGARAFRAQALDELTAYEFRVRDLTHGRASDPVTLLTYPALRWDAHNARASGRARVRLSHCALTATFDAGSDKWRTLLANRGYASGVHRWDICLDRMSKGYIFIGVGTASANPDTYVGGDAHGFGLFVSDRSRYHGRNKVKGGAKYGDQMAQGDVVGVVLDLDHRTLSYALNGNDLGVAFDDLPVAPAAKLFPAVSFYHRHDAVSFGTARRVRQTPHASSLATTTTMTTQAARVARRIATATRFARRLLSPSSSSSPACASHFFDLAYAFWRSWVPSDHRLLATGGGGGVVRADVSRAACRRVGLVLRRRVRRLQDGAVAGVLVGVATGDDDGRPVAVVSGDGDADPDLVPVDSLVRSAPIVDDDDGDGDARAAAARWTLREFVEHGGRRALDDDDARLVRACNDAADRLGVDPLSLLYDEVAAAAGVDDDDVGACARFALVRTFNLLVSQVLPYLAVQGAAPSGPRLSMSLGALVRRLRPVVVTRLKAQALADVLHQTATYTKPSEDPYEDPPDLRQITLNRHLAAARASSPSEAERLASSLFGQAATQLGVMPVRDLRRGFVRMLDDGQERTFKVKFVGEGVTDNGGPYRECFNEFVAELQSPALLPLLVATANARDAQGGAGRDRYVPAPACARPDLFRLMGHLVGIAVRNKIHLDLRLPALVWAALVGLEPTRAHLREVDAQFADRLDDALLNDDALDDDDDLTFECTLGDGRTTVDLVPFGRQVRVTKENRGDWARLAEQCRLHEADAQIGAIRDGFAAIVPLATFELLTVDEVEAIVCGRADFSVDLLRSVTVYEGGVSPDDAHVVYFWQVLSEMTPDEKGEFARFAWARTRLPVRADQFTTKFKIQPMPGGEGLQHAADGQLPQTHTCFFSIALPRYSSAAVLRERLLYAARNCQTLDRDLKLSDAEIAEIGDV